MDNPPSPAVGAAAVYCRISRDSAGRALGVERQEEMCRELAKGKGWPIAEVYVDNDISAYSGKPRPAYERMLADIEAGRRDAIIVVDQDRLTRRLYELVPLMELVEKHSVRLANVSGDLDLSSADGQFKAAILGAVAQQESAKKSERLKRQREQAAKAGLPHGGRRAYGYTPQYEVVASEAANVREAAERHLSGESLRTIAADWNDRGIKPAYAKAWRPETLRTMLAGPHLAALRVHQGEVIGPGQWKPVLTVEEHERLRVVLDDPRRRRRGRPPKYLLTSCLRCGRCGSVLQSSSQPSRNRRSYICRNGPGRDGCGGLGIDADHAEVFVTQLVLDLLNGSGVERFAKSEEHSERRQAALEELREVEELLESYAEQAASGRMRQKDWLRFTEVAEQRRAAAERELAISEGSAAVVALREGRGISGSWEEASLDHRRAVITSLLQHVVVHPAAHGANSFDPARVEPVWRT